MLLGKNCYLTPNTKFNSKWIKDLNGRPETTQLETYVRKKSIGENFLTLVWAMIFLNIASKSQATEAKINKWDCIKLKIFCTEKETINRVKRQSKKWEKIIENHTYDNGLISKIYKELKLNSRKPPNNLI